MKPEVFYALASILPRFFVGMDRDPRMSRSHVALYFSLIRQWANSGFQGTVQLYAKQGAKEAKMSISTYYNCLRDLHDFGYVYYIPSFKNNEASTIYLAIYKRYSPEQEKKWLEM